MTAPPAADIRDLLIAVDASDNARRAVEYVARLLGGVAGFTVTLLHVIDNPDEDYFATPEEKQNWLVRTRERMAEVLASYRQVLLDAGFAPEAVRERTELRDCPSMAECILAERDSARFGTIVVGRQGISRSEEFLFGSVSSKIVHHARNCTVWVVQ
jgi:nucleotide-binding universal stress UspA family protein